MKIPRQIKTCISCKTEKPATAEYFFYRNKSKGWLSSWCKDCRVTQRAKRLEGELEAQRVRRESTEYKLKMAATKKLCSKCGILSIKTSSKFCPDCAKPEKKLRKKLDKCVYKSRLRKAMPKWADKKYIKEFYTNRPEGFDVDHIIPIRGELVSGLHVPNNLQYLRSDLNMIKSNHFSLTHNGVK